MNWGNLSNLDTLWYTPLEMQLLKISDKYIEKIELDILINSTGTWSSGIAFLLLRLLMVSSV